MLVMWFSVKAQSRRSRACFRRQICANMACIVAVVAVVFVNTEDVSSFCFQNMCRSGPHRLHRWCAIAIPTVSICDFAAPCPLLWQKVRSEIRIELLPDLLLVLQSEFHFPNSCLAGEGGCPFPKRQLGRRVRVCAMSCLAAPPAIHSPSISESNPKPIFSERKSLCFSWSRDEMVGKGIYSQRQRECL